MQKKDSQENQKREHVKMVYILLQIPQFNHERDLLLSPLFTACTGSVLITWGVISIYPYFTF